MAFKIGPIAFTLTNGADQQIELPLVDLSDALAIRMDVFVTAKGDADAGDELDVYFQEASDDVTPTWNDRAHLAPFTGAMTFSAAAPEKRVIQWFCVGTTFDTGQAVYEPSGSAGGSRLADDTTLPGPMLGKRRTSSGQQARHRVSLETTDANNNSDFAGWVDIWVES